MSGNANSGRPLGTARPPPFRLAELQLLELEAELMPLLENSWEGLQVLQALRKRRDQLGVLLAGAQWRPAVKVKVAPPTAHPTKGDAP